MGSSETLCGSFLLFLPLLVSSAITSVLFVAVSPYVFLECLCFGASGKDYGITFDNRRFFGGTYGGAGGVMLWEW